MKNKQTNMLVRFLLMNFVHQTFSLLLPLLFFKSALPSTIYYMSLQTVVKKRKIGGKNHDILRFFLAQNADISLFSSEQVLLVFLFIGSFTCY